MNTRNLLRPRFLAAALVPLFLLAPLLVATAHADRVTPAQLPPADVANRPNIVLITTDDQRLYDMRYMPKTRKLLGADGVTFSNGLSPHPLCCPARAEMLTGQYAQNNGVYENKGYYGGYQALKDKDNTIAAWLHGAGYTTGLVGKFPNGYQPDRFGRPAGWTFFDPTLPPVYNYTTFTQYNDGNPVTHTDDYITHYVSDRSADLISQWAGNSKPFFLWSSYVAPHKQCTSIDTENGCSVAPAVEAKYTHALPGLTNSWSQSKPSFNEADMSDKAPQLRNKKPRKLGWLNYLNGGRARSLLSVDDAVAKTVDALAKAGVLDNTVIVFTSDNGYMLGEHRLADKRFAYEEALRVPFLLRGPGVPAGKTISQVVTTVDIAPTILEFADVTPGRVLDGNSMMRWVRRPTSHVDQTTLIQAGFQARTAADPKWIYRGVRTHRYTYIRYRDGFVELYDRAKDPYEIRSVAYLAKYSRVRAELHRRLWVVAGCNGSVSCNPGFGPMPKPGS